MRVEQGRLSLMRSVEGRRASLGAIVDQKRGTTSAHFHLGPTEDDAFLQDLSQKAIAIGKASRPDEAYDIAPQAPPHHFEHGPSSPDWETMARQLEEALDHLEEHFPRIKVRNGSIQHKSIRGTYHNTHGTRYSWRQGLYDTTMIFCAKEGTKVTSFNYTQCSTSQLAEPLLERAGLHILFRANDGAIELQAQGHRDRDRGRKVCR